MLALDILNSTTACDLLIAAACASALSAAGLLRHCNIWKFLIWREKNLTKK
jgi:hypothetical protein